MIPRVTAIAGDNKLGIRAPVDAACAIIGCAPTGDENKCKTFARTEDAQAQHSSGPLVEACAYAIETYGLRTVAVRAETASAGTREGFTATNTGGTSVGTLASGGTAPDDDYEVVILFVKGCTVGTRGGTYRISRDGGRNFGKELALGTADEISVAGSAGRLELGAGIVAAGARFAWTANGPEHSSDALIEALEALVRTKQIFNYVQIVGNVNAAALAIFETKLAAMELKGRFRCGMAHVRKAAVDEDASEYLDALIGEVGNAKSPFYSVAAARCRVSSKIDGRLMHRAPSFAVAPLVSSVPEHIEVSEIAYRLPGVSILDADGEPEDHDETVWPGLDDAGFLTLRSHEDYEGAYVNNARQYSPSNSDYLWVPYRRVVDLVRSIAKRTLDPLLSKGVLVRTDGTGRIDPGFASAIEGTVNGEIRRQVDGSRKATKSSFFLTQSADVLRTGIQPWKVGVVPLAYIKQMPGEVFLTADGSSPANVTG